MHLLIFMGKYPYVTRCSDALYLNHCLRSSLKRGVHEREWCYFSFVLNEKFGGAMKYVRHLLKWGPDGLRGSKWISIRYGHIYSLFCMNYEFTSHFHIYFILLFMDSFIACKIR